MEMERTVEMKEQWRWKNSRDGKNSADGKNSGDESTVEMKAQRRWKELWFPAGKLKPCSSLVPAETSVQHDTNAVLLH